MLCFQFRKMQAVAIAAAAMFCLAASETLAAADPAATPNVIFTAKGVFAATPISGADQFELAGEPFSISVFISPTAMPTGHGSTWAKYTDLQMSGTVLSAKEPTTPIQIACPTSSIGLSMVTSGSSKYELVGMFAEILAFGIPIDIQANIHVREGTLHLSPIAPFKAVEIGPPDTVTYSCPANAPPDTCTPGESTVLSIASGELVGTSGGTDTTEASASVKLHAEGAQIITAHADGTKSLRPIGATPVDLGTSSDKVALQFYASGVRVGSEIHVQIAGQDARVLYAGPANYFAGLDEVSVAVPRSLAGSGNVDVALTVDGRTASPVHIQIQ
jgi:hypothetical protein